jgi:hypothetical protein
MAYAEASSALKRSHIVVSVLVGLAVPLVFGYLAKLTGLGGLILYGPAILMVGISITYFIAASPAASLRQRALTSAHGLAAALVFAGAIAVWASRRSGPAFGIAFLVLYLVPLALVVISFAQYEGPRRMHLLQGPNLGSMACSGPIGFMASTGEWL